MREEFGTREGIIAAAAAAVVLTIVVMVVGCTNTRTPEGHEGYVFHDPLLLGKKAFVAIQMGPTSTGFVWKQYVINIDMRPNTYNEDYKILTQDNLNIQFESHARISLRSGTIQAVVENYGAENWFDHNVKQQYRAAIREEVRRFNAYDVKSNSAEIAKAVLVALHEQYQDSPILFETMSIGNIDYPNSVNAQIEAKLAAQQEMERKAVELQIAGRQAEIRVKEAEGIASAQAVIDKTLTQGYLQYLAIRAYTELANSPNSTFILVPTSPNGTGMPIILNTTATTDEDE